ncbi:hypothetical protein NP233_g10 [Leucocoprinus birnbaumii]|uniref:ribonuclease H n=1 Tax=Leucocoprinus birnbaumii TaxID=56174 RepID=A0AAD5W4C1_9AGAR|nr:hypothetical protein NP233_g10 [Leucocoprinus birnbaumii]
METIPNTTRWRDDNIAMTLKDAFQILTKPVIPQKTRENGDGENELGERDMELEYNEGSSIKVYIAGSSTRPCTDEARAGWGVYFKESDQRNSRSRATGPQTALAAELQAFIHILQTTNPHEGLHLISKSERAHNAITESYKIWENNGWSEAPHKELMIELISRLRERPAPTFFELINKDNTSPWKEKCISNAKDLAKKGRRSGPENEEDESLNQNQIQTRINVPEGVRLSTITQATAYRRQLDGLKDMKSQTTKENTDIIRSDLKAKQGHSPITTQLWHSLKRAKNLTRKHKEFLYKTTRGAYKVGKHWLNSDKPEIRERAMCSPCGQLETLDHIYCRCEIPGREQIWRTIMNIWRAKYPNEQWENPQLGEILGIPSATFKGNDGRVDAGKTRLNQILISEGAHAIWRLRCERVIQHGNDPAKFPKKSQIKSLIKHRINHRLRMDCITADSRKFDKRAIREDLVVDTWQGILEDEDAMPEHWTRSTGVLVGNRLFETEMATPFRPP